ncbi:MAG TPA: MFS transporter [Actinocatenispora sp.]
MGTLQILVRQRDVRLLVAGAAVSQLGSWMLLVAVPYQVFRVTGSATATSLALALEALPAIVVGPWAGAAVDRWDRRRVMVAADLLAAAGVALMLAGTTPDRLVLLYAGVVVETFASVFFRPASGALLPSLTGTGPDLAGANAALAFVGGAVRLVGPPLGTLLVSVGGLGLVVGVDVVSYLVSAALTAALPRVARSGARVAAGVRAGLRLVAGTPLLRGLLATTWVYWTANAALTALLVPFVVRRLHCPGQDVGYLMSGLGVGYLVGSALARRVVLRYPTRTVLAVCYAGVGGCFLVMFGAPTLPVAVVGAALSGVPGAVASIAVRLRMQADVDGGALGRVGAAFTGSDALAAVAGAAIAPVLVAGLGLPATLVACSVLVFAAAAAVPVLLPAA